MPDTPAAPLARSPRRRPRRSPAPAERRRDPERTKQRILAAAVTEFGEHGYAGARVTQIAARAEVNAQLISYYFDGKAGLYQALLSQWRGRAAEIGQPERPLDQVVAGFAQANSANRSWARLMVWEALGASPTPAEDGPSSRRPEFLVDHVADLRRRQDAGELPADLDPAYLLLALFAAASAPTVLPQIARRIVGIDPESEEFVAAYPDQVARLVRHLTQPKQG